MGRKTHNHPLDLPPLELKCMQALWALGEGTVHSVRDRLFAERPLAYNTVLTLMDRLARKGVVEREKRGRAHLYRPAVGEPQVREQALKRLVGDFFRGSREQLRHYLEGPEYGNVHLTAAALEKATASHNTQPREKIDPSLL